MASWYTNLFVGETHVELIDIGKPHIHTWKDSLTTSLSCGLVQSKTVTPT